MVRLGEALDASGSLEMKATLEMRLEERALQLTDLFSPLAWFPLAAGAEWALFPLALLFSFPIPLWRSLRRYGTSSEFSGSWQEDNNQRFCLHEHKLENKDFKGKKRKTSNLPRPPPCKQNNFVGGGWMNRGGRRVKK